MDFKNWPSWCFLLILATLKTINGDDDDYNILHRDGSFQFGYKTPDSYHHADANRNNIVRGEFGGRNPSTGRVDSTVYTAGPRGYRPRGKNIHRKYDLNQNGPRPIGSRDDPYYDPNEDPSYSFAFRTRTYNRQENANRVGDVVGKYNYLDDVGELHNVEYIAGKNTGFHVKTPYPDSNPRAYYGRLYFAGRGKPLPRGRTSIQRGLDGSYRFISAGPDQRRTETSDSTGHVRGSYTYLDDKGVQHSVHYIAGPETGYRVLKNVKGPHIPTIYPFGTPEIIPPDFYDDIKDDVFDTAASGSGHVKPINNNVAAGAGAGSKPDKDQSFDGGIDVSKEDFNKFENDLGKPGNKPSGGVGGGNKPAGGGGGSGSFNRPPSGGGFNRPPLGGGFNRPTFEQTGGDSDADSDGDFFGDLFDGPSGSTAKPSRPSKPSKPSGGGASGGTGGSGGIGSGSNGPSAGSSGEDGSYIPESGNTADDGSYIPPGDVNQDDGSYRPGAGESGLGGDDISRPGGGGGGGGETPRPGLGIGGGSSAKPTRPSGGSRPGKPSYVDDYDDSNDLGLFGSESNSRPPLGGRPTVIQVQGGSGGSGGNCEQCRGTIVTNVGDRLFTVPPGVSVRAHVQSIDLLPLVSKVPSPSEQYKEDMSIKTEQLNSAASDLVITNAPVTESDLVFTTITTTAGPPTTIVATTDAATTINE